MGTARPNRQGPNGGNVLDQTNTSEADAVLRLRAELGHTMLVSPVSAPVAAEQALPQPPLVGGAHEPAPQLVSAGQPH